MGEFNSRGKGRFGARNSGRPNSRFGGRDSRRPGGRDYERFGRRDSERPSRSSEQEMHEVTCDKCGRQCEVPFRPTGGKPVYCSDCFRKNGGSVPMERANQSSGELDQINIKLDKILRALKIE